MKDSPKAAAGFTLVEMLVVIAVIAILAAVLLPAISAAKRKVQRTTCTSNLRQINLAVRLYSDDANDASPSSGSAVTSTNLLDLYVSYKKLVKSYVGLKGASSAREKLFTCPADTFYPIYVLRNYPPWEWVRQGIHDRSDFDFSSYSFNGGDCVARMRGTNAATADIRPGLGGAQLSSVMHPSRTVLIAETSALGPWSWHNPVPMTGDALPYSDARNNVSFVDGHVSYIKIYWNSNDCALHYDPPDGYEYQWSGK
jgi:prepilin-type N-terminal cleavage/methylation domain-containing protein/prepilin-type processing-associated H-X9-DG protein